MNRICLLAIFLASSAFAGPLRFRPDTIRTGNKYYGSKRTVPESTVVVNTSSFSAILTIPSMVSVLSHATEQVMFDAPRNLGYSYKVDSSKQTGATYRQFLSRTNSFPDLGRLEPGRIFNSGEIRLAPHDSVVLGVFRYRSCEVFVVRALAGSVAPVKSCQDEPIDLVFGTAQSGYDTLHTLANNWSNGMGDVLPSGRQDLSPSKTRRFSADGRTVRPSGAPGIVLDPGATSIEWR